MVSDIILESFSLEPTDILYDPYCSDSLYEFGIRDINNMYMEASNGMNKTNVIQKIWNFIKKCIQWIGKRFSSFIKWIKNLFTKKKNIKSPNAILSEMNVPMKSIEELSKDKNVTINDDGSVEIKVLSDFKDMIGGDNDTSDNKSNDNKSYARMSYKSRADILKLFVFPFNDITIENKKIKIKLKDIDKYILKKGLIKKDKIKTPLSTSDRSFDNSFPGGYAADVLVFIKNHDFFVEYKNHLENIIDIYKNYDNINDFIDKINNYKKESNNINKKLIEYMEKLAIDVYFEITYDDLLEFQKNINEINHKLTIIENINFDSIFSNNKNNNGIDIVNSINIIASEIYKLQTGINAISSSIINLTKLDARYYQSITNVNTLNNFLRVYYNNATGCTLTNIPNDMISNIILLLNKEKFDVDRTSLTTKGQSRFVIFPKDNKSIVYKVALNSIGIRSNIVESKVSKQFVDNGGENLIAKVIDTKAGNIINTIERVDIPKNYSSIKKDIKKCRSDINNFCNKNKFKFNILKYKDNDNYFASINNKIVLYKYEQISVIKSHDTNND